jgi:hypothetical protein
VIAIAIVQGIRPADASVRLWNDLHLHLRRHFSMHLDRNADLADRLQRVGQRDLPLVDLEALGLERVRDVGGGHRSIERIVLADPAGDLDFDLAEPLRQRFGLLLLLGVAQIGELPLAVDLTPR